MTTYNCTRECLLTFVLTEMLIISHWNSDETGIRDLLVEISVWNMTSAQDNTLKQYCYCRTLHLKASAHEYKPTTPPYLIKLYFSLWSYCFRWISCLLLFAWDSPTREKQDVSETRKMKIHKKCTSPAGFEPMSDTTFETQSNALDLLVIRLRCFNILARLQYHRIWLKLPHVWQNTRWCIGTERQTVYCVILPM